MASNTNIEWTDHTFNIIRGCSKISPGCQNCYADTLSKRNPATLGTWGPMTPRVFASQNYLNSPTKWNIDARNNNTRRRVFCASLGDIFEDYQGGRIIDARGNHLFNNYTPVHRTLFEIIRTTPNLDWQLLTKRPENILPSLIALQAHLIATPEPHHPSPLLAWITDWIEGNPPANVWLGTSTENQSTADVRIPILTKIPAHLHFISAEPLLGPITLDPFRRSDHSLPFQWLITGGESGPGARPAQPDWFRSLRDQCATTPGTAFFFKQWGAHHPDGTKAHKSTTGKTLDGQTHLTFPTTLTA